MFIALLAAAAANCASAAPQGDALMIDHPVWRSTPSLANLAAAYPRRAGGASGRVVLRCQVQMNGALDVCVTASEAPPDEGFAAAARSLVGRFRLDVRPGTFGGEAPLFVSVPIRLVDPNRAEFRDRRVAEPTWVNAPGSALLKAAFPAAAAAKGVKSGRGVAECVVDAHGALVDCAPVAGDEPAGLGFGEAAAKVAAALRMSLWSGDGQPVSGAKVDVPVRFEPDDATTGS